MNKNKKNYLLLALVSVVLGSLFIIGSLSFTISFYSISSLAMSLGVVQEMWLARMFGVIIDLLMMASMGAHLYHSFEGHFADKPAKDDYVGYIQYFVSTNLTAISMYGMAAVSIWFNAIHSGKYDIPSVAMSSVPSVSMLVATEMIAAIIRTWVKNGDLATGIDSLRLVFSELDRSYQALLQEVDGLNKRREQEVEILADLAFKKAAYGISLSNVEEAERKLALLREEAERLASENRQVKSESKVISELTDLHKRWIATSIGSEILGAPLTVISQVTKVTPKTSKSDKDNGVEFVNGTMAMLKEIAELMKEKK